MRLLAARLTIIGLVATACSGPTPLTTATTVDGGAVPAVVTSAPTPANEGSQDVLEAFDGSATAVLVATPTCYAICSPLEVVPQYALYADRRLVWVERTIEHGTAVSFRLVDFPVDDTTLNRIVELMIAGGLTVGDVHATDTNFGIADGGGVVFETSIGRVDTYVHAPFLGSDPSTPDRDALVDLLDEFETITTSIDGEVVGGDWVAVGRRIAGDAAVSWPSSVEIRGGPACLVFDVGDLPDGFEALTRPGGGRGMAIAFGDKSYVLYGRPLLPHEQGCSDVRAGLERFATNDAGLELGGTG